MGKVICNVTFMLEREREDEFIKWIGDRKHRLCRMPAGTEAPEEPRLSTMRSAGGVDYTQAEAQSVAFQQQFASAGDASAWCAEILPDIAAEFERDFGPQAMIFNSVFEILPF